jgi:hypothetical protein
MKALHYNPGRLLLLISLVGIWPAVIHAQTPDGLPPANEGVCDSLQMANPDCMVCVSLTVRLWIALI